MNELELNHIFLRDIQRGVFDVNMLGASIEVRCALAASPSLCERVLNDPNPTVRMMIAARGQHADTLAYDLEPYVRLAVANSGKALDILAYDNVEYVRDAAVNVLLRIAEAHEEMKSDLDF